MVGRFREVLLYINWDRCIFRGIRKLDVAPHTRLGGMEGGVYFAIEIKVKF